MKTIDQVMRADKRRLRAQSLVGQIMHIVGKYVDDNHKYDAYRDLTYELFEAFHKAGVEIITDEDRRQAGLSPRGQDGWTLEEIVALEEKRLEIMRAPLPPMILPAGKVIPGE